MAKVQGDQAVKGNLAVSGNATLEKGAKVPYLEVIDEKRTGRKGGTFTQKSAHDMATSWKTRDLTTVVSNDLATTVVSGGADLLAGDFAATGAGGKITLERGLYYAEISAPAFEVQEHTIRLADVTDNPGSTGETLITGTSEFSADSDLWASNDTPSIQTRSHIAGRFELSSQRDLEVQHICAATKSDNGFGNDGGFYEVNNVYTTVKMWLIRE